MEDETLKLQQKGADDLILALCVLADEAGASRLLQIQRVLEAMSDDEYSKLVDKTSEQAAIIVMAATVVNDMRLAYKATKG